MYTPEIVSSRNASKLAKKEISNNEVKESYKTLQNIFIGESVYADPTTVEVTERTEASTNPSKHPRQNNDEAILENFYKNMSMKRIMSELRFDKGRI